MEHVRLVFISEYGYGGEAYVRLADVPCVGQMVFIGGIFRGQCTEVQWDNNSSIRRTAYIGVEK
jgi:hypothetical protein